MAIDRLTADVPAVHRLLTLDPGTDFGVDVDALVRLLIAAVLGAIIGIEREAGDQPAGLRTHISVAVGAALFGIISTRGFVEFEGLRADTNINIDVTRVASNVVVGIGFLGAGVIFRRGSMVHNLTTAASLWAVAAIGLATGIGNVTTAGIATVIVLASLVVLRPLRDRVRRRYAHTRREFRVRLAPGVDPEAPLRQTVEHELLVRTATEKEDGRVVLLVTLQGHPDTVQRSIAALARSDEVQTLHEV